jgi:hypothetical protein
VRVYSATSAGIGTVLDQLVLAQCYISWYWHSATSAGIGTVLDQLVLAQCYISWFAHTASCTLEKSQMHAP